MLLFFGSLGTVTYVAELLITKGYAFATKGAGSVAVYKFLTPVFSMIFDASVFGEMPNVFEVVGGLIVLASSAAMVHVQASKGAHAKTAPDGENDNVVVMCDGGASNDRSASDESDNAD
uniref:EamA domain-containing protein n=1 Tax=Zooxanthella nutricula TaxID=1333877 RepID=A0A7S2PC10_9DINO